VFQVGVVNALNALSLQPNLIAGSSVGSITAAMVARVFAAPGIERQLPIVRLAATFIALDHLVLTDRLADFVRRFTLRAAATAVSFNDVDRFFRRYDSDASDKFIKTARRVTAGLEHLFYISPWELFDITRAFRAGRVREADQLVRMHIQDFLDRSGVGVEILGTEPLSMLIGQHVFSDDVRQRAKTLPLNFFEANRRNPIRFLVTATNLRRGRLEVLGDEASRSAKMIDSLLASSAFPGIFRPRWGWEVVAGEGAEDQLVDGGVMDNLPLQAVVSALEEQAKANRIARRPWSGAPHLVFTASLEPQAPPLAGNDLLTVAESWRRTWSRAGIIKYNQKIDHFGRAQRDMRDIQDLYASTAVELDWTPLDIEVLVVKPKWLCGTYAFHPMLGFRRRLQAASIAHGCASTFGTISQLSRKPEGRAWPALWGIPNHALDQIEHEAFGDDGRIMPREKPPGRCYFRKDAACPFSAQELEASQIPEVTKRELSAIYDACGRSRTHAATSRASVI
jgi:predicted acylesterase/phospholipase RssA